MQVQPYLFFEGRCEEALEFYRQALDAQVEMLMRFRDSPEAPPPGAVAPGSEDKVMHASFRVGDSTLMASDGGCSGRSGFQGITLSLNLADVAEAVLLADRYGAAERDLHAIVFRGVVRSGDGDGGVDIEAAGSEVDHRCGDDAEVEDIAALVHDASGEAFEEARGGGADVAADREALGLEMGDDGAPDLVGIVFVQVGTVDASDIVGLENPRIHMEEVGNYASSIACPRD